MKTGLRHATLVLASCFLWACPDGGGDDLDAPMGGLDLSREQPLFGAEHEPAFVATGEHATSQALAGPPRDAAPETMHAVWAAWGRNPSSPRPDEPTTWTGTLSTAEGTLQLARTLAFDRRDRVLPPPDDRTVAFESRTRPHVDGVVALSRGAASAILSTPVADVSVALQAQPTRVFVPLQDGENAVAMLGIPLPGGDACAHPVVVGRRAPRNATQRAADRGAGIQARMVGRWFNADGHLVGRWRTFSGVRADGTRALFGKVIDDDGHALALLRGVPVEGGFRVEVLAADGSVLGSVDAVDQETSGLPAFLPRVAHMSTCLR